MAFDAFLKLDSVKGESTDKSHSGEIEVRSFSFGAANATTIGSQTGGSGAGKVQMGTFNIVKRVDSSSPILFQNCCSGDHFKNGTFTVRKAGGKSPLEYLVYTFEQLYVADISTAGATTDDTAMENVSFTFANVHEKYTPQKPDGTGGSPVEGGWDVTTNQAK